METIERIDVYGYARKSADDKEDTKSSINNQIKLIEDTCEIMNWNLVDIFIDPNVSGSDRDRKDFTRMINLIKKNNVSYIVTKEQNRFCRDSSFFRDTLFDLKAYNKKVYSILKNKFLDHEDLGDTITSVVDENYIFSQRTKTESLFKQKMNVGLPPIKAPFGYKNDLETKQFIVHKKNANIVREVIFDYLKKIKYSDTIKRLKIDKSKYYQILKNYKREVYFGWVYYQRKIKDSKGHVIRKEEIKYKGVHEPLITQELWDSIHTQETGSQAKNLRDVSLTAS